MNPHPSETTPSPLPPARQDPRHPPRWRTLSARERPIPQDAWISSVLKDPEARSKWESLLDAPRFVVSEDFAEWSLVVVSLQLSEGDNDLLSLLFRMGSAHQTAAWAVCRKTRQIYRLPVQSLPTGSPFAEIDIFRAARSAARAHPLKPFVTVVDWADPATRKLWEARLADRSAFELSDCSRPFSRAQESGEFASVRDGDRTWDVSHVLENVADIEARPPQERRQFWQRLHRRERPLARRAMQLICQKLDPNIQNEVRAAGLADGLSAQRLNWLSQALPGEGRTRRLQALIAAPLLLPMLLRSDARQATVVTEASTTSTLDAAIEHGEPLFPLLAQRSGLSERTVRHLRTVTLREHHLTAGHELHPVSRRLTLLSWLELIPAEQWPQSTRQWKLWVRVTVALSRQSMDVSRLLSEAPNAAASGVVTDAVVDIPVGDIDLRANTTHVAITHAFYRELAARRWKLKVGPRHDMAWDREDGHVLSMMGFELSDFLKALRPGEQHEPDGIDARHDRLPTSVRRELQTWSITDWWAASDRWHQYLAQAGVDHTIRLSKYANDDEVLHWLPLLEPIDITTPTALRRIEFLSNSRALVDEGVAMNHCVSVRVDDCLTQRSHIASVTDGDGRRCSTLAVRLDYEAGQWCPVQVEHRTLRNRTPEDACRVAVAQLMKALKEPELQSRFQAIEVSRAQRETALSVRLTERRHRSVSLQRAALKAALPAHVFLQLGSDDR